MPEAEVETDEQDTFKEPSDETLAARCRAGNREAFGELYRRHAAAILAFVSGHGPPGVDTEAIASESWTVAFARIDTFVGGSFRGWLFTIAKNALISVVRKPSHRLRVAMPEGLDPVARDANTNDELHAALRECLKSLLAHGDVNVNTLHQVKLQNEEPQTVAEREGITTTAVYGRVLRGLRAVGDCVKGKLS